MKHTIQKIPNVKNTARGIVILSWRKKYLYSTYIFRKDNKWSIIKKWPLPHPLRSTIYMLTRVSIPDDYVWWFFSRAYISEKEKCMFSGKCRNIFPTSRSPWYHSLIRWAITRISRRDRKWTKDIVIDLIDDTVFIDIVRTPVSPEDHTRSRWEIIEKRNESISRKYLRMYDAIGELGRYPSGSEEIKQRFLIDTITSESSLWTCIWPDEFNIRISPSTIIRHGIFMLRQQSNESIFGDILFFDRLYRHTECCDLTGEFIFLEREIISRRDIESWFF